jgi:hypothetical protein
MSKQLKNKSPTECDKGEVKREGISLQHLWYSKSKNNQQEGNVS